ncbi:MAG: adenylate kinase [Mariniblastus sp.]|jgi:adenylate kinase
MSEPKHYRSILMFGPPGAGKGTQGKILGSVPGFFHLSVGDVFRAIDIGSSMGQQICQYTSDGQLVPDELTVQIWRKTLDAYVALSNFKPREDLLVLDGIPRNVAQTELIKDHIDILQVINLTCENEEDMIMRMRRRAIRENRADDANEDVIRKRFEVFRQVSKPVLGCYPEEIISTVDSTGSPAEVLRKILRAVIPIQNIHFQSEHKSS